MTLQDDIDCKACANEGWVCENHPEKAWGGGYGCCGGAGTPCKECNESDRDNPPRMPEGSIIICDKDGWRH